MKCNLLLHCGGAAVERTALREIHTPLSTPTWTPIPHLRFVEQVERALVSARLTIVNQAHALSHGGDRYFGLIQVQNGSQHSDYAWVLGLRNSHDKRFPAGLVAGSQVFICDNLAFHGEVQIARKHTRFINRDLHMLTERAIGQLVDRWHTQDERIARYRDVCIGNTEAHDLMIRAVDSGVCPVTTLPKVLEKWREPDHEAFRPRNIWSLFNGFTEALKGNLPMLPARTQALHGLMDGYVGLAGRN
ncbi:DUF932 domain-containing protein [Opitutaceae bacterium TAV4]|nr:DUF932 domain-containing protein [Opitutaceae bacterium TAV4]RRJ98409.1 DUF932 domain-containing protein [Opitutaceae bacterium TAV3]